MQSSALPESWFIFQNDHLLLVKKENHFTLPDFASIKQSLPLLHQHALGLFNQRLCYGAEINEAIPIPLPLQSIPLRKAFELLETHWYQVAVKAYAVLNWDKNHQFCGRCGGLTYQKSEVFERWCATCKLSLYPRISPSIIVLIKKEDHLLMARSPHFSPGVYALIAGFVEVGETLEETVHREVREEVGIAITNLRYFGSQPWPFPDSLMIGFTADYAEGELIIDTKEIEEAGWYRYNCLPGRPSHRISIATQLINHFVTEQQNLHGI